MEKHTASHLTHAVCLFPEGYGLIDHERFCALPPLYAERILASLIHTLGGGHYRLRSEKLARLLSEMLSIPSPCIHAHRRTVGGLQLAFRPKTRQWLVSREAKATEGPLSLPPGTPVLWDGRFTLQHHASTQLTVSALGPAGLRYLNNLKLRHSLLAEKAVAACLPALWEHGSDGMGHLEKLLVVPHIGYHHPDHAQTAAIVRFTPAKPLADTAFFGLNTASHIGFSDFTSQGADASADS